MHLFETIHDSATARHAQRVSWLATELGHHLSLPPADVELLGQAALFHDIGKACLPPYLNDLRGPLSDADWALIKTHPVIGEGLCAEDHDLWSARPIIRSHHERLDGSGYPDGLHGPAIPLLSQVLQLADIVDAMVSPRAYRAPSSLDDALATLSHEAERGWRDPRLVRESLPFLCNQNRWFTARLNDLTLPIGGDV